MAETSGTRVRINIQMKYELRREKTFLWSSQRKIFQSVQQNFPTVHHNT